MSQVSDHLKKISEGIKIPTNFLPTLAILSYFSGWVYINEYFSTFKINRSSVTIDDYTIFVHFFFVIKKIITSIFYLKNSCLFLFIIASILILTAGLFLYDRQYLFFKNKIISSAFIWIWLIISIFIISKEAGRIDAIEVSKGTDKKVDIIFTESFKKSLVTSAPINEVQKTSLSDNEIYAKTRLKSLQKKIEHKAIQLIWRNANESIFLIFATSGSRQGEAMEVIRLNNNSISAIFLNFKK